jgi:undecaprenyl diphosphate synthase
MHVAIIMDGNGRWAERRGLPRTAGHAEGAKAVRRIVEAAAAARIDTLTLYAFSADNWNRPAFEVATLMRLFRRYLMSETQRCVDNGIRMSVIGRRDRLSTVLLKTIAESERFTEGGAWMHLRIAVDYSARWSILRAAQLASEHTANVADLHSLFDRANHSPHPGGDVDLLIRTGGEQRLSDFLLFECAYAELCFLPCLWPDFTEVEFAAALADFAQRERRFGKVPVAQPEHERVDSSL